MARASGKVLFLLLDAFRHDYINAVDTPFLFAATQKGVYARKLKSTTGFTQRSAVFTGSTGMSSGMFTMYTFDPDHSPFHFVKNRASIPGLYSLTGCLERLPPIAGLRKVKRLSLEWRRRHERDYRQWLQKEANKYASHAPPAYIPLDLLPYIGVSEDNRPIHLPGALEQETIFDVLSREGIDYRYLMFPAFNCEDDAVLQLLLDAALTPAQVILGQFSDSDLLIHHCGPSSPRRRAVVGEIDRRLRTIASCYGEDVTWVIIGDHGMTDVVEVVDVGSQAAKLAHRAQVKQGRDFLLFLDSTMARFYWLNDKGKQLISIVEESEIFQRSGMFIDGAMAREYSIPLGDRRYGDTLWWANVGTLIFPDYFHDAMTRNKGMHGYDSKHDDMKGFFLAFGPGIASRIIEEAHLVDVCPSLCAAVGVGAPASNEGRSLLS